MTNKENSREEYLRNKHILTDEDIMNILDLPPEKEDRSKIKSYTEKEYEELKN